MTNVAQAFNHGMDVWKENQEAPWGKLRYRMVNANLALHLTEPNQVILDWALSIHILKSLALRCAN
ncbi:MAG: hypothetical protein DYG89_12870 [Caldilinea sp. CFX5]|nr:hypothetical protein [Caldilinea sp. CFX5]